MMWMVVTAITALRHAFWTIMLIVLIITYHSCSMSLRCHALNRVNGNAVEYVVYRVTDAT
jgi:hypothetical protein